MVVLAGGPDFWRWLPDVGQGGCARYRQSVDWSDLHQAVGLHATDSATASSGPKERKSPLRALSSQSDPEGR